MDGYWDPALHGQTLAGLDDMGPLADEWYDVARNDPGRRSAGSLPLAGDARLDDLAAVLVRRPWPSRRDRPCHHRPGEAADRSSDRFLLDRFRGHRLGWACDPDGTLCEAPRVDLQADGSFYMSAGYTSSQDYVPAPECGSGIAYRFTAPAVSGARITAVAQDLDSGGAALTGSCGDCVWYSQRFAPKGTLDSVDASGYAYGWVCDPDSASTASPVRLVAGGVTVGLYTTGLFNEPAVTTECGGGVLHRFGVQLPTWARGKTITAFAENLGSPGTLNEVQIRALCRRGRCVWR